jgi:ribonuclease D
MCKSTKKFLDFIIKMAFFLALFGFSLAFLLPLQTEMKKTIYQKYDKSLIPDLPRVLFEGRVFVVLTESEARKAVDYLLSQPLLGLDTETRPTFRKGPMHQVALLQVSSHDVCFLFRLCRLGLSPSVKRLLEDTTVPKVGLSLTDDMHQLRRLGDFETGRFIDLQNHVREVGVEDMSLQKLYANFFGQKISKRQQLTNWEADILTEPQKLYAATDAWACVMLYEELMRLEATNDYTLVKDDSSSSVNNAE